jgi:hypothetical protein
MMNDELLKIMGGIPDSIPSLLTWKKIAFFYLLPCISITTVGLF